MFAASLSVSPQPADRPQLTSSATTSRSSVGPAVTARHASPVGRWRVTATFSPVAGWRPVAVERAVSPAWLRKLARDGVSAVQVDDGSGRSEHMIADLLARPAPLRVARIEPPRQAGASQKSRAPRRQDGSVSVGHVAPDSHRAHGERAKYVVESCRCSSCRAANIAYGLRRGQARRRPEQVWAPYVPAARARRHLKRLAEQGLGMRSVAKLSGVSEGSLVKLLYGEPGRAKPPSRRIRPATEQAILAVQPHHAQGAQRLPAAPTWKLVDDLVARGFTRVFIARQLSGPKARSLQLDRYYVRASTARRVAELHRRLVGTDPRAEARRRP